ncbi:MAG: peptidylprolyl isomerase [Sphingobacteriales bacterium]|nr:peptidylprolyl isomerase [Sphingobacteriales bacterium]
MQIIQGIRDKGAAITIAVIALALIAFILMDAKRDASGGKSMASNIGKINGRGVELSEFNKSVKQQEDQEEQRYGRKPNSAQSVGIRQQMWDQMVIEKLVYNEADKLGIDFTSKELYTLLSSEDPANPFLQDKQLMDASGKLDISKVNQAINNIKKMKGEQRDALNEQIVDPSQLNSVATKYFSLISAGTYYPTWMEEKNNKETKAFASVSYVSIPYTAVSDSAVKVTDADVEKYISKNKDKFKQEAGRMISYVSFSQLPNSEDSARIKESVIALKESFKTETNIKAFIARNTSVVEFDSNFLPKSKIQSTQADSIVKIPVGEVYGPYVDKGSYVIARVLGTKTLPDSVKARHILIPTIDPQTRQPIAEDSVAKKQADSIFAAIQAGADFAQMAQKFSSDGSKDKGGDLGTFGYGAMVPEFNDFCFNKTTGSRQVVRTMFGYHIIEIMSQKGNSPAYKVALLAKEIQASEATINNASFAATKFATDRNEKSFDTASLQKKGLQKVTVPTLVKENDGQLGMLQEARQLIRWAFDAKKGDVSDPYSIDDQFVVATVDNILSEGTQDVKNARPLAESAIKQEKKGALILTKLGNAATLESAAAAYALQVLNAGADSSIVFTAKVSDKIVSELGQEPKVIGACFNKENQTKPSTPIVGKNGVYVIKVNSLGTKNADNPEVADENRKKQISDLRSLSTGNWIEALKKNATIKDSRSEFY